MLLLTGTYCVESATNTSYKLHILGHDSNPLGMDGTQVGVLEKDQQGMPRRPPARQGRQIPGIEDHSLKSWAISRTKTLEGELADEKIGGLLVPTDLTKGNSSRSVTVGLLHTSGGGGGLTCCLGGELLTGGFASGGLTGGLLGTGHIFIIIN